MGLYVRDMDDEMWAWVEAHMQADPLSLRLRYRGDERRLFAILQIECRRKAASKLRDTLSNSRFIFPTSLSAEQATSDILARFHSTLFAPGERVLDMTCGLGIDAFHIASKVGRIDSFEITPEVAEAASHNAAVLGLSNFSVTCRDSVDGIRELADKSYDTVFIDPARRGERGERRYALRDCSPDVVGLLTEIARVTDRLIVKASPMLDITETVRELPSASDIYIIGTLTECKELTLVADFSKNPEASSDDIGARPYPMIHAVTLMADGYSCEWSYRFGSDGVNRPEDKVVIEELEGKYLYEPFPSVMKAGGLRRLSSDYPQVRKLHRDTHLFVSDTLVENFPGRCHEVLEARAFASSEIRKIAGRRLKVNVTARNFPLTAPALVKKLHVTEGGTQRLFAATLPAGPVLILTRPVGDDDRNGKK